MEPISTGVPGLDRILNGGLRPRGLHVLGGMPGTGKTTLAQQISYHHAKSGGRVLYLVALSETAERLVGHASGFSFFDPAMVAHRIYYISVYGKLEEGGLPAVLDEARMLALERKATLVCLDGLSTLKAVAPTPLDFRRFMFDLNAQIRSLGATTIIIGPWVEWEADDPEFAVAEGIVTLSLEPATDGADRYLEVLKLRGSQYLEGRHAFDITKDGIQLFPRLEAVFADEGVSQPNPNWQRASTGAPGLDQMLQGGIPTGSVTLLAGVPGAGKTVLGLSFLAEGGRNGERGIYLGFDEAPSRLLRKSDALKLRVGELVDNGNLEVHWRPALELIPDEVAWWLLSQVDSSGAQRLVIDGIDAMITRFGNDRRSRSFITALMSALRGRNITTLVTYELPRVGGAGLDQFYERVSSATDNIIVLQYVELRSELRRLISILKVRDSDFDNSIREFIIAEGGLRVSNTFGGTEAVLTGIGHWRGRRTQ